VFFVGENSTGVVERIFALLNERHETSVTFASAIGVSQGNVSDWKRGRSKPSIEALGKIADFFNVSADYLLGRNSGEFTYDSYKIADVSNSTLQNIAMGPNAKVNAEQAAQTSAQNKDEHLAERWLPLFNQLSQEEQYRALQYLSAHSQGAYTLKTCFVALEIGEERSETRKKAREIVEKLIEPAAKGINPNVFTLWSVNNYKPGRVDQTVVQALTDYDIAVVVWTNNNANVAWEYGYRAGLKKPLVVITNQSHTSLPVDFRGVNTHKFDDTFRNAENDIDNIREFMLAALDATPKFYSVGDVIPARDAEFFIEGS
jgi:transcriptional regulator with XRE-family HTH domain